MKKYFLIIGFFLILIPNSVYGVFEDDNESIILITQSEYMKDIIFDGKWTFYTEWKNTSWNPIKSENQTVFHLRSAHQDNFIYFFLDVVSDKSPSFSKDKAMICIDSKNNKSLFFDEDDFCFIVELQEENLLEKILEKENSIVLKGESKSIPFEELSKIITTEFIGIGTISDDEDRYSKIPHTSFEFKIPTELIGRSDNYGFFVSIFDSEKNIIYSWPENIHLEKWKIPTPSLWGNLISPDKSLPEFGLSLLIIIPLLFTIIGISKIKINHIYNT